MHNVSNLVLIRPVALSRRRSAYKNMKRDWARHSWASSTIVLVVGAAAVVGGGDGDGDVDCDIRRPLMSRAGVTKLTDTSCSEEAAVMTLSVVTVFDAGLLSLDDRSIGKRYGLNSIGIGMY